MSMRNYMKDLMRAQKASEVRIVHDASISSLPDEHEQDSLFFASSISSGSQQICETGDTTALSSLFSLNVIQLHPQQQRDDCDDESSSECCETNNSSLCGTITTRPGNSCLVGFRERHRRIKETLSPVKVYRSSSYENGVGSTCSQITPSSASSLLSEGDQHTGWADNLRSRLTTLASDSSIIDGPFTDTI